MSQMTPAFIIIIICTITFIIVPNAAQTLRLHSDSNSLTLAASDYGNIVHEKPFAILDPRSVKDIIRLVRSSSSNNTTIAIRGHGHSLRGQVMALGGVVVNITTLMGGSRIIIRRNYVDVGAEQLWINVLKATLKRGLAPVSWTDYLHLSVGGTLSYAGVSGQAFKYGPQISNVLQLAVVTGKGQYITCSPSRHPGLFLGVLGGLGQFGIITKARIVLHKAPTRARWAILIYSDFSKFTSDQEHLISGNASSYVEGFIIVGNSTIVNWRSVFPISSSNQSRILALLSNHSILYVIEMAKYYDNHTANTIDQEFQELHEELNFIPGLNFTTDVTLFDFLYRVGNLDTPATGSELSHPWMSLFIPKSNIVDFNKLVLAGMLPILNETSGIFIFYPLNKNKWNDAMSAVTVDGDVFYTVGLLHSSPTYQYQRFDDFNNKVLSVCRENDINVKEYIPMHKTRPAWENHFGSKWKTFLSKKIMFDPKKLLSPGQRIFN